MVTLAQVISWFGVCRMEGQVPTSFSEVVVEPENAHQPGWLYIPATNPLFDGRALIPRAIEHGASAVVVDAEWFSEQLCPPPYSIPTIVVEQDAYSLFVRAARARRENIRGDVFAITGSVGKTTTRALLAAFLRGAAPVCETIENGNSGGGQCETLLRATNQDKYVVSEIGICGGGQMVHSCRLLRPSVAILTSIGMAHVGNFRSREALAREKIRIFDKLWGKRVFGVIPREMDYLEMVRERAKVPLIEVSLVDETADYYGIINHVLAGEMTVVERATGLQTKISIGRPGRHICMDALLAFAAARSVGVTPEQCIRGLRTLTIPGARWRTIKRDGITYVDDTFNASPSSVQAVLNLVQEIPGQVIIVLGDMLELGIASPNYHYEVGQCVAKTSPKALVTYGPYSTSELADAYDMQAPSQKAIRAKTLKDVQAAVRQLAKAGDTVIYKASNGMHLGEAIPRD